MTDDEFWAVIEASRRNSDGSFDERAGALAKALRALPAPKIAEFDEAFFRHMNRAYSWDLWGAAYVIQGGCSDDGFTDFRYWLISLGRTTYERALADPESLVDVDIGEEGEEDASFEEFGYVANQVYEEMTSEDLPAYATAHPDSPSGEQWEEDELEERFSKLCAKYG